MSASDVRTLHRPVEIEPSDTICGECSWQLPNGRYFGKVVEYPCPTLYALDAGRRTDQAGTSGAENHANRTHEGEQS